MRAHYTYQEFQADLASGELSSGEYANKYGAVRTTVDGITFASAAESKRYKQLRLLVMAKEIQNLELQVEYTLNAVGGDPVGKYVADFRYIDTRTGLIVVEDKKGVRTPLYNWKKRHMKAQYGIDILET